MALAFVQATTGIVPLGAADPTARLEGYRDLAHDLDFEARAGKAEYILTQGYALTSLMTAYGDPEIPVVQPEQRIRWIFAPAPPEPLFAEPGLALSEAGRRFDLILKMRFRSVEPAGVLERRRAGLRPRPMNSTASPTLMRRCWIGSARAARSTWNGNASREGRRALGPAPRQRAEAHARASFAQVGARTEPERLFETGGLRWRFPRSTSPCEAVIVNTGGGVAGGDSYRVELS